MSFKCKIGLHSWDGCKCSECGKIRNEQHDWSKDCEKCSNCSKTRENQHVWQGCKCSKCGKTRDEQHDWNGCKCTICDTIRMEGHSLVNELCSICNRTIKEIFMEHLNGKIDVFNNLNFFHAFTSSRSNKKFNESDIYSSNFNVFAEVIDKWGWKDIEKFSGVSTPDELVAYAKENYSEKRLLKKVSELLNKTNSTFVNNEIDSSKISDLTQKLISDKEGVFIEGLSDACNRGDNYAVNSIREAIKIRSKKNDVLFYTPGIKISIGNEFIDSTLSNEQAIMNLVKEHALLRNPEYTGELISSIISLNPFGADDILTKIYEAGDDSDGYEFQLIYNELVLSNRIRNK